jgi:hypothetical protein
MTSKITISVPIIENIRLSEVLPPVSCGSSCPNNGTYMMGLVILIHDISPHNFSVTADNFNSLYWCLETFIHNATCSSSIPFNKLYLVRSLVTYF